jgi:hypothetical protein
LNDGTIKACMAIAGLVVLDSVALFNGIDGTVMAGTVALIAGLGGYSLAIAKNKLTPSPSE